VRIADLRGQRVAVWGAGVEGTAALAFVARHCEPSEVFAVVDDSEPEHRTLTVAGTTFDVWSSGGARGRARLRDATVVLKSPGVSPYHGPLHQLVGAGAATADRRDVTGGTALWFAEAAARGWLDHTIGVTGSKGKSTTSSLIAHLLRGFGRDVTLAGNVGRAPLDLLDEALRNPQMPVGRIVLELSSFQSAEVNNSPAVGVLTTLFPEHLDWHETIDRYYADKFNLFAHGCGAVVANLANPEIAVRAGMLASMVAYGTPAGVHVTGEQIVAPGGHPLVSRAHIPLRGLHNAVNVCGAVAAIQQAGVDLNTSQQLAILGASLRSFQPLAHRLEVVGEVEGRTVVDDSLSTAPQAAVAALGAYADRPVAIIVGGHDRGLDYTALAEAVSGRELPCWVFGVPESGKRIVDVIRESVPANPHVRLAVVDEFDDAVVAARAAVPVGGVLLLSPAAPSFGRFKDYRERGMHFRRLLGLIE
jgi:UDP-N-acetylmuramoyl-L-alanine---L-glutamate ligase